MRSSTLLLKCLALLTLGTLSACSTGSGKQASSPQLSTSSSSQSNAAAKHKVAILLPLSGTNKALGEAMLNAAQMALFDIGYGHFELIPRDTKGTPAGADEAARSAIAAGAQLILGPVFAPEVRAVKPIAQSANLNIISFSTDWTLSGGNTFIMGFLPFDQIERISNFASLNGAKNVGIIAPQNEYGRAVTSAFTTMAGRTGLKISATAGFAQNGADLASVSGRFAATARNVDTVLIPAAGAQATQIASALTAQGLPPARIRRLGTGLFDDAALAKSPDLDGAWFAAPAPSERRHFEQNYLSVYGQNAPRLATLSYDATALAAVLAKRSTDSGARASAFSRTAITNPNGFSGIDGIFRFRPSGSAERGLAVLEFKAGQIHVLDDAPKTFEVSTQ